MEYMKEVDSALEMRQERAKVSNKDAAEAFRVKHEEKKQKLLHQTSVVDTAKAAADEVADEAIAAFFYGNGLSFNVANDAPDSLYRNMVKAIKMTSPGYGPPGKNKLWLAHCSTSCINQPTGKSKRLRRMAICVHVMV